MYIYSYTFIIKYLIDEQNKTKSLSLSKNVSAYGSSFFESFSGNYFSTLKLTRKIRTSGGENLALYNKDIC